MTDLREYIRERSVPEPNTGCWIWLKTLSDQGYARTQSKDGVPHRQAHRVSYVAFVGPVDPTDHVDHLCRNRWCVNPQHLEAVSPRVNILRGVGVAAVSATKTHCHRGHALTEDNIYRVPSREGKNYWRNARYCRKCRRMRHEASQAKRPKRSAA